jgi:hypothetical protein
MGPAIKSSVAHLPAHRGRFDLALEILAGGGLGIALGILLLLLIDLALTLAGINANLTLAFERIDAIIQAR